MEVRAGDEVVVVVAHPDDETFGCGSLIAHAVALGGHVTVVCATRGEAGERVQDPSTDGLALGTVREAELRAAADLLGVHAVELLGYADSGYDGPLPDGAFCSAAAADVAAKLAARFADADATTVIALDGGDGHRDHLHARRATELALEGSPRPVQLVLSCLSNRLMRRWVEEMASLNPDTAYLDIDLAALGTPDELLTPVDTSAHLALRERAIACHRSQRSPYDGISGELRTAFLATDTVIVKRFGPGTGGADRPDSSL